MRIGLFGGTFNPVHWGHLRSVEEIRENFSLKKVIFVPASLPPHKEEEEIVQANHRFRMVAMAVKDNPFFSLSDFELQHPGKSYSIDTINYFRQHLGERAPLFFIVGIDAFLEITTWKSYQDLFFLSNFIVMTRPGYGKRNINQILPGEIAENFSYDEENDRFVHSSNFAVYFHNITLLDISSTLIRRRIKKKRSVKYLLPEGVRKYMQSNRLYRD